MLSNGRSGGGGGGQKEEDGRTGEVAKRSGGEQAPAMKTGGD